MMSFTATAASPFRSLPLIIASTKTRAFLEQCFPFKQLNAFLMAEHSEATSSDVEEVNPLVFFS